MKIGRLIILLCCFLLVIPSTGYAAADKDGKERVRHQAYFKYDKDKDLIMVRERKASFDTGQSKDYVRNFFDKELLPRDIKTTRYSEFEDAVVTDTPQGLKAYAVLLQPTEQGEVKTIYEYDYTQMSLRKVKEIETSKINKMLRLEAKLGLYSLTSDNRQAIEYYSLMDNKRMLSGGEMILAEDVINTEYSVTPQSNAKDYSIYCSNKQYKGCYYVEFGGLKGKSVKVTHNQVNRDFVNDVTTKAFMAGNTKIKWKQDQFKNKSYQWVVEGIHNGKTISLYKGRTWGVKTFVSPSNKYLVLIVDSSSYVNKTEAAKVLVYDLKTLKLVQKYDSLYKNYITGIEWADNDTYIIKYYFSNPGAYPPSFYYIPEGKHLKIEYSQYRDWHDGYYWDSFSDEKIFYPTLAVGITSGKGVLKYKGQPSFYMNGKYYVPLEEFTDAFHINYVIKEKEITFTRNRLASKFVQKDSGLLQMRNQTFIPLGQWNKDLGLKVSVVDLHSMATTLQISDSERKTGFAMAPDPSFRASVERIERIKGEFIPFPDLTPTENPKSDYATLFFTSISLNYDKSVEVRSGDEDVYGKSLPILITSKDYKTVYKEISLDMKDGDSKIPPLPDEAFEGDVLTIIIPISDYYAAYKLKWSPFDKSRF